jgi:hypothetical protein
LAVKKFEEDADKNAIVSERTWAVTLRGRSGQAKLPTAFRFPSVKLPAKEVIYQRYDDADLAAVGQDVSLERVYGTESRTWLWLLAGGLTVGGLLVALLIVLLMRSGRTVQTGIELPTDLNAFTVLQLLQRWRDDDRLTAEQRAAIGRDIEAIERHYFAANLSGEPAPDLRALAVRWANVAGA